MSLKLQPTIIQGNRAWWSGHRRRILDARGPDVLKFVDDFLGENTGIVADKWAETAVNSSTAALGDAEGGILELVSAGAENDGIQLQLKSSSFSLASGRQLYFGTRLKVDDATQSDLFAGLAVTDTTILGGVTDSIGFRKVDGSAAVEALTEKDSTETSTAGVHTLVDDTFVELEFFFDGSRVEFFVNQASAGTHSANIPNDVALRASLALLTGEAAARTMTVDWVRIFQFGRGL